MYGSEPAGKAGGAYRHCLRAASAAVRRRGVPVGSGTAYRPGHRRLSPVPGNRTAGLNPRTAIGQRSDGAILLLVIDGRQVISIGASLWDLVDIFQKYGAVNACNLDGGSSTLMWYQGDYINNCASVIGIRPVPTTFLVLKEGRDSDG